MSKWAYLGNWVVGLSAGLSLLIAGIIAGSAVPSGSPTRPYLLSLLLSALGWAGIAWAVVWLLRFVYRMWSAVPAPALSPRRAVAFLFLPVFNLYWIVRVFCGFARLYNAEFAPRARALPLGLFALFSEFCSLTLLGAAATLVAPFTPAGRALAAATFACAAVSAILAVYVISSAFDAIALLESRRERRGYVTAQ